MLERKAHSFLDFDFENRYSKKVFDELSSFHRMFDDYFSLDSEDFKDPVKLLKSIHTSFIDDVAKENSYRIKHNAEYGQKYYFPPDSATENFPSFFYSINLLLNNLYPAISKQLLISKIEKLINKNLDLAHKGIWALKGMSKGFYSSVISDYQNILEISKNHGYKINTDSINSILEELNSLLDKSVDKNELETGEFSRKYVKNYESKYSTQTFQFPETYGHPDIPNKFLTYTVDFLGGKNYNNSTFDSNAVHADYLTYFSIPPRFKREEVDHKDVDLTLSETYQFLESPKNLNIIKSLTILNLYMFFKHVSNDALISEVSLDDKSKLPFKIKSFPRLLMQIIPLFKEYSISYRGKIYKDDSALKILDYANNKNEQVELILSASSFENLHFPEELLQESLTLLAKYKK
jgi:hypothetical protein